MVDGPKLVDDWPAVRLIDVMETSSRVPAIPDTWVMNSRPPAGTWYSWSCGRHAGVRSQSAEVAEIES